jgi:hypothetical protein
MMTTSGCIDEEKLAFYAELPPESPARTHVATCARCRARVAAFVAFAEPRDVPAGAMPDDADTRLAAILESEIRGAARTAAVRGGREHGGVFGSFLRGLARPGLRPIWAIAALVVVVFGVREVNRRGEESIILREERDIGAPTVVTRAPSITADGGILLLWDPVADADRYAAVLYSADLEERTRIDASSATSCRLPDALAEELRSGKPLFWRVLAFRAGDEIASARMTTLSLRDAR